MRGIHQTRVLLSVPVHVYESDRPPGDLGAFDFNREIWTREAHAFLAAS